MSMPEENVELVESFLAEIRDRFVSHAKAAAAVEAMASSAADGGSRA